MATNQCEECGRYFRAHPRVGNRQKTCGRAECKRARALRAQRRWRQANPEYRKDHYEQYVKPWRQRKRLEKQLRLRDTGVIKKPEVGAKPYRQLILEVPVAVDGVIKNEIALRRPVGIDSEHALRKETADMDEKTLQSKARHLHSVEGLSLTQTARELGISRKKITRLIRQDELSRKPVESIIAPYERLIQQWYGERPYLRAVQIFERLKGYGYEGGYTPVKKITLPYRSKRKAKAYHELVFLPGEEAQVDWMQRSLPFGVVYGFVYILSYSRYLYGRFYPRCSMEFFLEGHIEAFREIKGVPQRHRYDNLRSVVIKRRPETIYNPRFLDFARHYGFTLHACNPGRANEKGRVERVIQDIGRFMSAMEFSDLSDLNKKFALWRTARNNRLHRTTQRTPGELLKQEKLTPLPAIAYKPYRHGPAVVSKTCFITCDTNRYSVPTAYSEKACDLLIYPHRIEVVVNGKTVAVHPRVFAKRQKIEHPGHRAQLLQQTPQYKQQRMYQLLRATDKEIEIFLNCAEQEGQDPLRIAYELFKLLKGSARATLISAVAQANSINTYRVSYLQSLMRPAQPEHPVHPQDPALLHITYEGRNLSEYDTLI